MLEFLSKILSIAEIFSLAAIIGGTLVLGALVTPVIFDNLSRQEASITTMELFDRFEQWLKVFAGFVFAGEIFAWIIYGFSFFPFVLGLAILLNSSYIIYLLSPQIHSAYAKKAENFADLHKRSELLYKLNFAFALILLLIVAV